MSPLSVSAAFSWTGFMFLSCSEKRGTRPCLGCTSALETGRTLPCARGLARLALGWKPHLRCPSAVPTAPPARAGRSASLSSLGSTVTLGSLCAWRACGSWRRSVCPERSAALPLDCPRSQA